MSSIKHPGTNASVPGCLRTNKVKIFQKIVTFYSFFPSFPWLSWKIPGRDATGCQNPVPARIWTGCPSLSCPVPWQDFELVLLSFCPGITKDLLSLCLDKLHCPVPLEILIWKPHLRLQLLKFCTEHVTLNWFITTTVKYNTKSILFRGLLEC